MNEMILNLYETGHFWNPDNSEACRQIRRQDLSKLTLEHPLVREALISRLTFDHEAFERNSYLINKRPGILDGIIGEATVNTLATPRCSVPDFAPPIDVDVAQELKKDAQVVRAAETLQDTAILSATGSGNWRSCNNIGNFHCSVVRINFNGMPSHLRTNDRFYTVLKNVQNAYARLGLLFVFMDTNSVAVIDATPLGVKKGESLSYRSNIEFSFVSRSTGWIGLAIVGTNQGCSSNIWCRFLSSYVGGTLEASIINQWTTLIMHELGHNCGKGHTSGGVMNPSVVNNLPLYWAESDPSYSWLVNQFGGKLVTGQNPDPDPDPDPDLSLEERVGKLEDLIFRLQLKTEIHDVLLARVLDQLKQK